MHSLLDDKKFIDNDTGVKHVIVIDDDDDVLKSDFSGQADLEPSPSHVKTANLPLSKPTETPNRIQPKKPANTLVSTDNSKTLTPTAKTTTPTVKSPAVQSSPLTTQESIQSPTQQENIPQRNRPEVLDTTPISTPLNAPQNTPLNAPIETPESVIAYRTLRSPSEDGPDKAIVSIAVKSSQSVLPSQHLRGATVPTTPPVGAEPTVL